MADNTTPLLQPYAADPPEPGFRPPPAANRCSSTASLDDMIERCVGSIGSAQLFQAVLVSFAWVFDAQQTFVNVFADAAPSWHCTGAHVDAAVGTCSRLLPGPCGLPAGTWAWDRHPHASVISEWSLECAGPYVTGLPASAYFAGCLVGGLALATLADSTLGRKKMLFVSCLGMAVVGLLTAASPNVWVYSALRFVGGFFRATIGTSALVLSTELVGKKWRGEVGIIGFFCFTLGFLSLPAMAYANRNSSWRSLYLWTSAPGLLYSILVYCLVRESPRWLLVRGRKDEAIKTLKDIAASNGKDVLTYSFSGFNVFAGDEEEWNNSVDVFSALRVLLDKRWALRRLAAVMAVGFGIGIVYYGMPLAVGSLGSDLYLSVALNALSELPSALVTFFLIGRINRRAAVLGFTLASGACSVACAFLEEAGVRMGVEVTSFFSACTAFNVILIYGLELFPTCVRNSALSMLRQALVLGGVFAPLLVAAARGKGGRFTSFGVFGLVIAGCGLFVVCLPETRGGGICDTLEEQEYKEKSSAATAAGGGASGGDNPLA
ncbi:hypothetical protein Taro_026844 [Colocasia esculenta]|uniref:H(+)/Pi cotransporter n=1 Tax=Colocasia esculenta TaxID=4460 RepID=A0A843VKS3_COLES|nr:hypothetical protein [Colocasia esculenta]